MNPVCIITGCVLWDMHHDCRAHGDLHMIGDTYVFNAAVDSTRETVWIREPVLATERVLYITGDYFERRGVIVVHQENAELNPAARKYIGGR